MNMEETLALIQAVSWQGSRLGLERVETLMHLLGDPQKKLRFVHVAGTNGKGSVSVMLSAILTAAGYTTGLYTSPHLVRYQERMQIGGVDITEADFCALAEAAAVCVEQMEDKPTEFELLTAMALLYFTRKGCDIVVLEVGLGGRLDATNVIDPPEVAVIMNLGLEHTEILGDTLEQIAGEKAGIIKEGCAAVTYPGPPEVEAVFEAICTRLRVPLRKVRFSELIPLREGLDGQSFHWRGQSSLRINLLGRHQLCNAVMALETVEVLRVRGWSIPETAVQAGLAAAQWPARLEVIGRSPLFLLDGAHNPQCAQALAESILRLRPDGKTVFLTGVLADKNYREIMALMMPLAQEFFCLTPDSNRALSAEALADYLTAQGAKATASGDVASGIFAALSAAGEDGIVVSFGSLYLAGGVREAFRPTYRKWLRKEKIKARDSLPPEVRETLSHGVVRRILDSPEFQQAKTVMLYRAIHGEVRLDTLEAAPETRGKRLVYPLCTGDTQLLALLPKGEYAWGIGRYGIAEPLLRQSQVVPPEEIDLVLCPCTVFDETCSRMGMGAGYYDRYLPRCAKARIASVAFEAQKTTQVPTDPWDYPMELTFTEKAVYRGRAAESRKQMN